MACVPLVCLVVLESTSERVGSVLERLFQNLSFALVFTCLALVFAILVSRRLARPLIQMAHAAEALSHDEPASIPGDAGSSEIIELSHSLVRMAQALRGQKAQTEVQAERLQEANLVKDEFLGILSHELKNPLAVIYGGSLVLLRRRHQLPEDDVNELVKSIVSEADRAEKLIDDLLLLARIELGTTVPLEPISLQSAIEPALRLFTEAQPQRKVTLELPEGEGQVLTNQVYLHHVVANLLSNADKYSPPSQPIELRARTNDGHILISVRDHGPGVSSTELARMFETFYRSERTSELEPGKGLGLTVCRRLLTAMGSSIWASLPPDGGLEVSFTLNRPPAPQP